jgi:hypothetical protein
LYAALFCLDETKTSDPQMKENVRNILTTWGRLVGSEEAVSVLWTIVEDEGGEWQIDGEGEMWISAR